MNSIRSNSLKYQRFTPSGCKDIEERKCEFVAKTQFLLFILLCTVEETCTCTLQPCYSTPEPDHSPRQENVLNLAQITLDGSEKTFF